LTFGQAWGADGATRLRPTSILYPRFVRFNATLDFWTVGLLVGAGL